MFLSLMIKSLLRRKLVISLLVVQLAVTVALLINSGLLAVHARELLNRDTGLDLDNTVIVALKPISPSMIQEPFLSNLLERQLDALRTIEGVKSAAFMSQAVLTRGGSNGDISDIDNKEFSKANMVPYTNASPDVFAVLGTKLIEGQFPEQLAAVIDFDTVDLASLDSKQRKLVITQSLAKHIYGDKPAVGRFTSNGQVVAVVSDFTGQLNGDNKNFHVIAIEPLVLGGQSSYILSVRVQPGMADRVRPQLTEKLRAVDPNIDFLYTRTLDEQKTELYRYQRGLAILLIILSGIMLVVAMISAYSNAFFHALQQHQEIGIKRALGANKQIIFRELLAETWLTTALGVTLGLGSAWMLNRALATMLETPAIPLWLPLLTIVLLLLCVTFASWHPTRIAVNISPVTATKAL